VETAIVSADTQGFTRRRFLAVVGVASATGACSAATIPPAQVGDVPAGNVDQLPVGSLVVVGTEAVCIGRDAGGIYAMTLTCTHAGCDIGETGTVSPEGLLCGCHESEFDPNGNVVRGPATKPLDHFDVSADASGNLTIHGGEIVTASQRLRV